MRLICPNCGAQYEVPVEVIPAGGRDVQCSNCAHTWYQNHPDEDPVLSEESDTAAPDEDVVREDEATPESAEAASDDSDGEEDLAEAPAPPLPSVDPVSPAFALPPRPPAQSDYDDDGDNAPEPSGTLPAREGSVAAARARSLDPSVAEVLREEAARESRQRAAEFSSLESQPELGLDSTAPEDESARRARETRERMARMRGVPPTGAARETSYRDQNSFGPAATSSASASASSLAANTRRDLLPDVEEINQTLRSTRERRNVETVQGRALMEEPESGFGRGFTIMLLLAALLAALYILAPQIGNLLPPAEPLLSAYSAWIDQLRLWLDDHVTSLLLSLDSLSSEASAPDGA